MYNTNLIEEDGKLFAKTTFHDDAALQRNKDIADSGMLEKGTLGIHDDADFRAVISCPSVFQWNLFKRDYPDLMEAIEHGPEQAMRSAIKRLSILHPGWVVYDRL